MNELQWAFVILGAIWVVGILFLWYAWTRFPGKLDHDGYWRDE